MKNFVLFACLLVMSCAGCSKQEKGCMTVQPQDEVPQILAFAAADSIDAIRDSSGIYYRIEKLGSGKTPEITSTVTVSYIGKFLNGNTFDQNDNYTKKLEDLIEGWSICLKYIKEGGKMQLIIPSAYGYGCNTYKNIPSNSILFYEIELKTVQF